MYDSKSKTLIASLGQSPAVITETLDHLRDKKNLVFDRLVIIAPGKLPLANAVCQAGFLENGKDFSILDNAQINSNYPHEVLWSINGKFLENVKDIRSEEDAVTFFQAVLKFTKLYCYTEDVCFAIAGGRKSMSALMVLAAQILPIQGIFHVLMNDPDQIQDDVARKLRDDDTLMEYLAEINEEGASASDIETFKLAFHPDVNSTTLVEFKFLSSFEERTQRKIVDKLCEEGNLRKFSDVHNAIYNYIADKPPKRATNKTLPDFKNDTVLKEHLYRANQKTAIVNALNRLWMDNSFIENAKCKSRPLPIWRYGWAEGGKKLNSSSGKYEISLYIPVDGNLSAGYHLYTTATTDNQAKFIYYNLKKYFLNQQKDLQRKVLISTLGESPGIVTAPIHFYEKKGLAFDRIIVIAPQNDNIWHNCLDILERQPCLKGRMSYQEFEAHDIMNQKDIEIFMKKMQQVITDCVNKGYQIYLNLSGGRKVMSGALLLLGLLYDVESAFHLSVLDEELDEEIERFGEWRNLNTQKVQNPDRYKRILYPDNVALIDLNVAKNLVPTLPAILK